jgi:hypothetical protein
VLTVGVDLVAEAVNTAVARVAWRDGAAEVEAVTVGADDAAIVAAVAAADKAGIDCPLGWPRRFVEFVAQHQAAAFVAPADVAGRDWRRQLACRETDLAQACRRSDHALDAVLAALNARAAALGRATTPATGAIAEAAATEGWIALPTCALDGLAG